MHSAAPWLAHYDPDVPASLEPYPARTLVEYFADAARSRPDAPALLFKGARLTYAELERLSDACASAMAELGVSKGDRVGLLLPNSPQFFIAQFGAWKLGAIVAPFNPTYTERELEGPVREHGIGTIVTLTRFYHRVKQVQRAAPNLRRIVATNIKEYFPAHLRLLFTLFREKRDGDRITLETGDYDFARLLQKHRGRRVETETPGADDPAVLLMSGGTTGTPKGVLGRHSAYVRAGLQIFSWNRTTLEAGDVILVPLPLFHVYANVGVQALAWTSGCSLALVPNPRDIPDLLATIRRTKPAFFNGVPTLYIALLNHPDVRAGKVDFKSIKVCFSGASALMSDTKQRFEALTGARIVEGYSLTEAMMALCVNPVRGENKAGSVGMPLPDVHVRIFDADEGERVAAAREVGEIAIAAPQVMIGFSGRPEETREALRDHTIDGVTRQWLHTGDLGYLDDDGYLFIVDRKKDLIKTSGFQVWPREIEEVLATHPAVAEAGVAGIPDSTKGEAVKAWVVLRPNQTADESALRAFCREKLAPYKVPSSIEFRTELPKTMVGKVLRRALRDSQLRS
jgi:long-chain acyl-CoA synthetase